MTTEQFRIDGIHFKKGMIPNLPFDIYLDLAEPMPPKPRGSKRVDYIKNNFCAKCNIKYPKTVSWCLECHHRVRTKPWHGRSNFANGGRY